MKTVLISLGLGVVLILGVVAYLAYPIVVAIRTSKSIVEAAVPFERTVPNTQMRILIAGDSTGVGVGARIPEESIGGRVAAMYPNASVENVSVSGLRIAGLHEILEKMPPQQYDLMLVQIGANDVTGRTSYGAIEKDLNFVLDYAEQHASSTILLTAGNVGLSPAFKQPVSWYMSSRTLKVRELFMRTAAARMTVTYVDLYKSREDDVFNTDIPRYYAPDRFHPSSDGYAVWFEQVEPVLRQAQ